MTRMRFAKANGGPAAIEFAIMGAALCLLVVGIGDLGLGLYCYMEVRHSSQSGAEKVLRLPLRHGCGFRHLRHHLSLTQQHDGRHLCQRLGQPDLFNPDFLPGVPGEFQPDFDLDCAHTMRRFRLLSNVSGATALEFALCAPAFFMLVMGIVELGLLVWMQLSLQQGVEAAARCISINKYTCSSTSQTQAYAAAQSY